MDIYPFGFLVQLNLKSTSRRRESQASFNNAPLRKAAFQVNDHKPFSPKGRSLLKITLPIHLQTLSSIEPLFHSY